MIVFESILSDVNYVAELIGRSNGSFYTILVPYPNPYMATELVLSTYRAVACFYLRYSPTPFIAHWMLQVIMV